MITVIRIMLIVWFVPALVLGQGKAKKPQTLFTVRNEAVTTEEFIYLYNKNHPGKKEERKAQEIEEYLDLFINFKLKVREARARGLDTTRAFRQEFATYRSELVKPYLPDNKIMDSLVALTYERMKWEVRASHILLMVKEGTLAEEEQQIVERAKSIKERIVRGEDFGSLASLYSEDQSARVNKGDLGYFTAMQMVYPFESAAYAARVGEVVGPVRTQYGYHLIKVTDRQPCRGEVEVSHIMLRTTDLNVESAKEKIFSVYDMLVAGADWNEMCATYSEDANSKGNHGKLRAFGVGVMNALPAFEKAAFSLANPGDISDPVQTPYGWHILKLDRKIPLRSFEELRAGLRANVLKDERFTEAKSALLAKYRKDFQYVEVPETRKRVLALADSFSLKGSWPSYNKPSETLFSISGNPYTVEGFLEFAKKHHGSTASKNPQEAMTNTYNTYVDECLLKVVEQKAEQSNPDLQMLTKEYYEGILLFSIMEEEVWNKAARDSAGQLSYYAAHASEYKAGERIHATLFSSQGSAAIDTLMNAWPAADSAAIMDLATRLKLRTETGRFEANDRGVLSKVPWTTGTHKVESNGLYYLAWIHHLVPPGQKSFDECRAQVISDYQNQLEREWITSLKSKYPVKVNAKGKNDVLEKLL
jgi:peptidyl-prolyl cis-trans isomerase SurA